MESRGEGGMVWQASHGGIGPERTGVAWQARIGVGGRVRKGTVRHGRQFS